MKKLSAFARTNWQPLALLSLFLTGLLLCSVSLYGEQQGAYRGDLGVKVMEARLKTARTERDARLYREHNESVAARWKILGGSPKEAEALMASLMEKSK